MAFSHGWSWGLSHTTRTAISTGLIALLPNLQTYKSVPAAIKSRPIAALKSGSSTRWGSLESVITPFTDTHSGVCYLVNCMPTRPWGYTRWGQATWDEIQHLTLVGNPTWTAFQLRQGPPVVVTNEVTRVWWSLFRRCLNEYLELFTYLGIGLQKQRLNHRFLPDIRENPSDSYHVYSLDWVRPDLTTYRVRNFSRRTMITVGSLAFAASLSVLSACTIAYGGIHATAWRDHFPSSTEQLLWRISSIYVPAFTIIVVVACGPFLTYGSVGTLMREYDEILSRLPWILRPFYWMFVGPIPFIAERMSEPGRAVLFTAAGIGFVAYLFCRSFLVIEAFGSLRSERAEVYQTADWTQYLLHL